MNADTPVLHINGAQDSVISITDGQQTANDLSQVIHDYTWRTFDGNHGDFLVRNPSSIRTILNWLDVKTNVSVRL